MSISPQRLISRAAKAQAGIPSFTVGGPGGVSRSVLSSFVKANSDFARGIESPQAEAFRLSFYSPERTERLYAGQEPSIFLLATDPSRAAQIAQGANARARAAMPWLPETKMWTPDYVPFTGENVQQSNLALWDALTRAQGRGLFENMTPEQIRSELGHYRALAAGGQHRGQASRFGRPTAGAMTASTNASMGILPAVLYARMYADELLRTGAARKTSTALEKAADETLLSSTEPVQKSLARVRAQAKAGRVGSKGGSR